MSELYSGTESAVRCGGTIADLFPVVTGVRQCVYWPPHFSAFVWTGFWGRCLRDQAAMHRLGMSRSLTLISQMMQSSLRRLWISFWGPLEVLNEESGPLGLRASWVKTKIQAFNDTLDAAILYVLVCGEDVEVTERFTYLCSDSRYPFAALEVLNEESETLGIQVSWVKTVIQAFNDILDAAILSVPVCGKDVEDTERFIYLGSDIHVSTSCEPEVNRRLGRAWELWIQWIMVCGAVSSCLW